MYDRKRRLSSWWALAMSVPMSPEIPSASPIIQPWSSAAAIRRFSFI
ncbi:hypothetical protein ACQX2H_09700 [Corynebacterium diphtheriae]